MGKGCVSQAEQMTNVCGLDKLQNVSGATQREDEVSYTKLVYRVKGKEGYCSTAGVRRSANRSVGLKKHEGTWGLNT